MRWMRKKQKYGGKGKGHSDRRGECKGPESGRRHIREKLKEAACGRVGEGAREAVGGAGPKHVQSHTSEKRACTLFLVGCESFERVQGRRAT